MDINILWLFFAMSFGIIFIGYLIRFSFPISIMLFVAGGLMFALLISVETITTGYFIGDSSIDIAHYDVRSFSFERSIFTDAVSDRSIIAENVDGTNGQLIGDTVNCMELFIRKVGSTPTADIRFGIWDVNGNLKYTFGTFSSVLLTTSHFPYKECNTSSDYTIIANDRIGVEFDAGNSADNISIRLDALNPFDGTVTVHQDYNDVSNVWTSFTANDITGEISFEVSNTEGAIPIDTPFTQELKVFMVLMASIICLVGGVIEFNARK